MKTALLKAAWLGRATVFLVGLSVILAAMFAATSMAFAANGKPLILGSDNAASALTTLVKSGPGPALRLLARPGNPPMVVNTRILVPNFNADMVDGKHASDLSSSCPAGTRSLGGGCIETTVRGTNTLFTASSTCAGIGRRLPTAAELDAFRQQPNVTIGSASSSMEWTGDIEVNQETGALAMSDSGQYSPADRRNSHAFRCVASSS